MKSGEKEALKINMGMRDSEDKMTRSDGSPKEGQPSLPALGLLRLIRFYQAYLSPAHPACCRFSPTCSAYAAQAIHRHGAFKGSFLSLWRLLRCQPFSKGGYDPVPERKTSGKAGILSPETGSPARPLIRKEV